MIKAIKALSTLKKQFNFIFALKSFYNYYYNLVEHIYILL